MALKSLRDSIQTAMDTVSGLRVYDTVPDSAHELPCAWVRPLSGSYHNVFVAEGITHNFETTILVARAGDIDQAQNTLDDLLDPTGSGSLAAAIEATTLGADGSSIMVTGYRDYGGLEFGGVVFIGAKLDVQVLVG